MKFARFDNILAIQTASGKLVGFHTRNMQVAKLDAGVWDAFSENAAATEERAELELWSKEVDPTATDADIAVRPRSILVNIAQICNLKCDYCAAGGDGTFGESMKNVDLDKIHEQIRMLLHDTPNGGTFNVTFFGGEPLVAPDALRNLARFVKLQVAGRDIRIGFFIVTNGTLVTPQIAELLASLEVHVTVSVDAPPAINDLTRKTASGRGSSAMMLKGLSELMKVRSRLGSLSAGAVFGKHHVGVLETYQFLRQFDFDMIKIDFAAIEGDEELSRLYAAEVAKTADFAFASGGEREVRKINLFDGYFEALDQQRRLNNHCGAGKSHFTIDGKGRMAACQWFIGRPKDELNTTEGKLGPLNEDRLHMYAGRQNETHGCGSCWARHLCGGGCMYVNEVKTGSKQKKDQVFCERTRNTIAKAIELYAEARNEAVEGDRSETH